MRERGLPRKLLPIAGGLRAALVARELLARAREADLHGQVAVVTGGTRGLGLAIARELADEGCRLAICARDPGELQRAGEELRRRGAEVLAVECDVGDKADFDRMIAAVGSAYGRIDLLVCNAGVIQVGQLESMELGDFRQAMDIMYWGALYPILAALPGMRTRGQGRIAVVTSIGGKISTNSTCVCGDDKQSKPTCRQPVTGRSPWRPSPFASRWKPLPVPVVWLRNAVLVRYVRYRWAAWWAARNSAGVW